MLPISPVPMQRVGNYGIRGVMYPGKLQAVAIIETVIGSLEIIGGLFGLIYVLFLAVLTFGIGLIFIPIPIIFLTVGILSLVAGVKGLNKRPNLRLSFGISIAQMCLLLLCDFLSFGAGLAGIILLTQDEVKAYRRISG